MTNQYTADSVVTYEGTDAIRKRPTMYVGSIGKKGNQHIIKELIDNSIDEFFAGYGKVIEIVLDMDQNMFTVADYGRGIPVVSTDVKLKKGMEIKPKDNVLSTLVEKIHAGGKFNKAAYQSSGGLNGVGLTCANALSNHMSVICRRDGFEYTQEFSRGKPTRNLTVDKEVSSKTTGTSITFSPDSDVMKDVSVDVDEVITDIKLRSYLNAGLEFQVKVIQEGKIKNHNFKSKEGIVDLVKDQAKSPLFKDVFHIETDDTENGVIVDIALAYESDGREDNTITFANGINTTQGGTHLQGFRMGLSLTLRKYMEENNLIPMKKGKPTVNIVGDDYREGLNAVISVRVYKNELFFDGQTKDKLDNKEVQGAVQKVINNDFRDWLDGNPSKGKAIAKLVVATAKGRQAAKNAKIEVFKDSKGRSFLGINDFGKLMDCDIDGTKPEEREVFITEGDSASGTVKKARDSRTQAIYPLRGKIPNTLNRSLHRLVGKRGNKEITDLVQLLGTGIGKDFNIDNLRYKGGIYLLADSDSDGEHIKSLLLTFFITHMPELVEEGYIYISYPPLYSVEERGKKIFFLNEEEYTEFITNRAIAKIKEDDSYTVNVDEDQLFTIISKYMNYDETLDKVSSKYTSKEIFEDILYNYTILTVEGVVNDIDSCLSSIQGLDSSLSGSSFEFMEYVKSEDGTSSFNGFYNEEYKFIPVDDNFDEDLVSMMEYIGYTLNVEGKPAIYKDGNPIKLPSEISDIIKEVTPKHRSRYKGLGENNPDELEETVLNPNTRLVRKVVIEDLEDAKEVTSKLFDSKRASDRQDFIDSNADFLKEHEINL